MRKVTVEKKVLQVCLALKGTKAPPEFQASLASKVLLDQGETLDQRAQEDQEVVLGLLVRGVTLVYLVLLAEMVNQVLRGLRGLRVRKGKQDLQDHKDLRALLVLLVYGDYLAHLDLLLKWLNLCDQ